MALFHGNRKASIFNGIENVLFNESFEQIHLSFANMAILNLENGEDITMKINQLIANNINHLDAVLTRRSIVRNCWFVWIW